MACAITHLYLYTVAVVKKNWSFYGRVVCEKVFINSMEVDGVALGVKLLSLQELIGSAVLTFIIFMDCFVLFV